MKAKRAVPKIKKADEARIAALMNEFKDVIGKLKFLVRRSEFLHQQSLLFHVRADEFLQDRKNVELLATQLEKRWNELLEKLKRKK